MCNSYRDTRLAYDFVNLTGEDVRVYDAITGNVVFYGAYSYQKLPKEPSSESLSKRDLATHYIVTMNQYQKIKASGRKMDDIAIVYSKSNGRVENMVILVWGKNPHVAIALMRHTQNYRFGHL